MKITQILALNSTNQYLKDNYQELSHFDSVYTKNQTKGRGRLNNSWYSNNDSLTFSLLLKDKISPKATSLIPLYSAMIIHQSLTKHVDGCLIKWPNDIYFNHKKIAGILVESIYSDKLEAVIIGFGINLNNERFPEDLQGKTTSLKLETNKLFDHLSVLEEIIKLFDKHYLSFKLNQDYIIDYCNKNHLLNKQMIEYNDAGLLKQAKCLKIDSNGHLLVNHMGITKALFSGQVNKIRF